MPIAMSIDTCAEDSNETLPTDAETNKGFPQQLMNVACGQNTATAPETNTIANPSVLALVRPSHIPTLSSVGGVCSGRCR